jgi:hypothetical protein
VGSVIRARPSILMTLMWCRASARTNAVGLVFDLVLLPEGVTGFLPRAHGPGKGVDLREVTALAHLAARLSGGRVATASAASVTPNFHSAMIITGDRPSWIIVNQIHPLVAAATSISMGTMSFIDGTQHLKQAVALTPPFRLLSALELSLPVTEHDLVNLSPVEKAQIRYWQPESVGDMIFNYWD